MKELSSIEIKYLIEELKQELENTKIERIFQNNEKEFLIQIYKRNQGKIILNINPNLLWAGGEKSSETITTNFLQQIRKHLEQGIITEIEQIKNERIIKIKIQEKYNLIIELFGKGNIILTDQNSIIITALEKREWKTRKIFPKEKYKTPESNNILDMSLDEFCELIKESQNNISQTLAVNGLGKLYAEETCIRAEVNPTEQKINSKQIQKIYEKIQELKNQEKRTEIIYLENKIIDITPIELKKYKNYKKQECKSFNEALTITSINKNAGLDKIEQKYKQKIAKLQTIIQKQEQELKESEKQSQEEQQKAERIYENYQNVKEAISKNKTFFKISI